jgi:hypothetical protein
MPEIKNYTMNFSSGLPAVVGLSKMSFAEIHCVARLLCLK